MKIYGIYDLDNKEQCLKVGDIREIINFLGVTARGFGRIIKNRIYKHRYEVLCVYEEMEKINE